jgi:hypothetical protein
MSPQVAQPPPAAQIPAFLAGKVSSDRHTVRLTCERGIEKMVFPDGRVSVEL